MEIDAFDRNGAYAFSFDHNEGQESAQDALDHWNDLPDESNFTLEDFEYAISDSDYPADTFPLNKLEQICDIIAHTEGNTQLISAFSYLVSSGGYPITAVDTMKIDDVRWADDMEEAGKELAREWEVVTSEGEKYFDFVRFAEDNGIIEYDGMAITNASSL